MSPRVDLGRDVFEEALSRMVRVYENGDRVVVSFSAGKDSGVCLELCVLAATIADRLPVEVVMRDEEIMYPGTYEYAERVAARPEIAFRWLVAGQPIVNAFNRTDPYFWVFDDRLDPERWVRQPPSFAERIPEQNILSMVSTDRFPPDAGRELIEVVGLRVSESAVRRAGLHSSGGYLTRLDPVTRKRKCRPIYDWTDGDVWRAIRDQRWDYNAAYDVMYRMGIKKKNLRIGPPTMTWFGIQGIDVARRAWPRWFDRVADRLPGVRTVAMFGKKAVTPDRRMGESWRETLVRECIDRAPAPWIAERARKVLDHYENTHASHATTRLLPDVKPCPACSQSNASYRNIALAMYNGNPFAFKMEGLIPYMEPEFFRPGAGFWGGKPTW